MCYFPRGTGPITQGWHIAYADGSNKEKPPKRYPTEDMWADINTKALQGSLFYKMRARLMDVPEDYNDDVERRNTYADLLPKEAEECAISQEAQDLLHKAGALSTLVAATKKSLPNTTRKTQVAMAALLQSCCCIQ